MEDLDYAVFPCGSNGLVSTDMLIFINETEKCRISKGGSAVHVRRGQLCSARRNRRRVSYNIEFDTPPTRRYDLDGRCG